MATDQNYPAQKDLPTSEQVAYANHVHQQHEGFNGSDGVLHYGQLFTRSEVYVGGQKTGSYLPFPKIRGLSPIGPSWASRMEK
ncbi:hypothetical protein [Novosphingobium kaempferiae]|uniref:hypothetical protein n=1 Tax=Novosphingobium kaempferiae TaxID=2896849 RepID=UPI001E4EFE59|nr:hypothetical protein [Novosphingobium kaempferiae]